MENREAIEWFKKRKNYAAMVMMGAGEMFELAIAALEQKEDLKWTRTADGLPDPWVLVWVTDRRGRLAVCQMSHKTGDWYDDEDEWLYDHDSIVAWMPCTMPEPYKEEEQDG